MKGGKSKEISANWWLWQRQILLGGTQWKKKRPWTKAASRENLIRYKKKSHNEYRSTSEEVVQSSHGIHLEMLRIKLGNWRKLNWPQRWFCFEQEITPDYLMYSTILWLQKPCSLGYIDNSEAPGTRKSLEYHWKYPHFSSVSEKGQTFIKHIKVTRHLNVIYMQPEYHHKRIRIETEQCSLKNPYASQITPDPFFRRKHGCPASRKDRGIMKTKLHRSKRIYPRPRTEVETVGSRKLNCVNFPQCLKSHLSLSVCPYKEVWKETVKLSTKGFELTVV